MNVAYIIPAHKNPQQLGRLVGMLHAEWVSFSYPHRRKVCPGALSGSGQRTDRGGLSGVNYQRRGSSDPPFGLNAEVRLTHLGPRSDALGALGVPALRFSLRLTDVLPVFRSV